MKRRTFLAGAIAGAAMRARAAGPAEVAYPAVVPGHTLEFPRDFGSHPAFRTEWWYVTGWLQHARGPLGVQVTFFRHRPGIAEGNPSRFSPTQLVFAHAAIADPDLQRLRHDQRVGRAGFGLAYASETTTDVRIDDWSLRREGDRYRARVVGREFSFDLAFDAREPPLLEGAGGYSRKGPREAQASYYYSEPQLAASGEVRIGDRALEVTGRAWCDHEWSSEYLPSDAAGWDWTGINLADGSALMAFVMRSKEGGRVWASATLRGRDGAVQTFAPAAVRFLPRRTWRSPRTRATYPVAMQLTVGGVEYLLDPLFDDQELDSRGSTGTVYWEGAVRALSGTQEIGRGYLELTGYAGALRM